MTAIVQWTPRTPNTFSVAISELIRIREKSAEPQDALNDGLNEGTSPAEAERVANVIGARDVG